MRLKVIYTFLLCLFWIANLAAQLPHDFRSEQIFLGVAKTEWAPNDTIEAKGIFYTPFGLSGGKGESQDNSHSRQIPTAYGCGVANRHNLIRA